MYSESMSDNTLPLYNLGGGNTANQNHYPTGEEEND